MEKNVGKADAYIRLIVGLVAIYLSIEYSLWWLMVAVLAIGTALTRKCWLYSLCGCKSMKETTKAPVKKSVKKAVKKKK